MTANVYGCRQEKLEQLAARFDRKAGMREVWLSENQRLVAQDNFGFDLAAVEAAVKKHEAIETDINAYEERVQAVVSVAQELETEKYHDIERITARKDNVLRLWQYLLELLKARRMRLGHTHDLQKVFMVSCFDVCCVNNNTNNIHIFISPWVVTSEAQVTSLLFGMSQIKKVFTSVCEICAQ